MSLRTVLTLAIVIVIALWVTSNPARAGDDIHSLWAGLWIFLRHIAGSHSR